MLKMNNSSKTFLKNYLPEAFEKENRRDVLELLYDLIDEKGFAPPHYDSYNDFGRKAQKVYDDIYYSNE